MNVNMPRAELCHHDPPAVVVYLVILSEDVVVTESDL